MTATFTRTPRTLLQIRRNRARNPHVGVITGYTASASGGAATTVSRNTGVGSPVSSICATCNLNATAATWWGVINDFAYVTAGVEYTFSAYMRPNVAGKNTQVMIDWLDAADASILQSTSTPLAHAANAWERRDLTATAPPLAVKARLIGRVTNGGVAGNTLNYTGLLLESGNVLGIWFDGDTANSGGFTRQWTGAVNDSESVESIDNPADILTPVDVVGVDAGADPATTIHRYPGTASVDAILWPAGPRAGALEVLLEGGASVAVGALDYFRAASLFIYADPDAPALGMTFAVAEGRLRLTPGGSRRKYILSVPFVEKV